MAITPVIPAPKLRPDLAQDPRPRHRSCIRTVALPGPPFQGPPFVRSRHAAPELADPETFTLHGPLANRKPWSRHTPRCFADDGVIQRPRWCLPSMEHDDGVPPDRPLPHSRFASPDTSSYEPRVRERPKRRPPNRSALDCQVIGLQLRCHTEVADCCGSRRGAHVRWTVLAPHS